MIYKDSHLPDADLLLAADGELPAQREREVRRHLKMCWTCRSRMAKLERTITEFADGYHGLLDRRLPPGDAAKALLRSRLGEALPPSRFGSPFLARRFFHWKWPVLAACAFWAVFAAGTYLRHAGIVSRLETGTVPNPGLTPGEIIPVSKSEVCQVNSQASDRQVPEALQQAVFAEYGIKGLPRNAYEVDFLITPELGGSASIRNLWPEPYFSRSWNAHAKDALEERLHKLVCNGELDLSTAQREIATNWVGAYKKYVRPSNPM